MIRVRAVAVALAIAFAAPAAVGQSAEEVVAKLKARRQDVRAVKYEVELTARQIMNRDAEGKLIPVDEPPRHESATIVFDFKMGNYRWDTKADVHPVTRKRAPYHGTTVFHDGVMKGVAWPDEPGQSNVGKDWGRTSDFAEFRGDLSAHPFEHKYYPLFVDCGICPLTSGVSFYPGQVHLYDPADGADLLNVSTDPQGTRWFDCAPKRFDSHLDQDRFTVDADKRVRQVQWRINGAPVYACELTYGKGGPRPGLASWKYQSYTHKKLVYTCDATVKAVEYNPTIPADTYKLEPQAGMVVKKIEYDKASATPDVPSATSRHKIEPDGTETPLPERKEPPVRRRPFFLYGIGAVGLLAMGWTVRRLVKREPTSPAPTSPSVTP